MKCFRRRSVPELHSWVNRSNNSEGELKYRCSPQRYLLIVPPVLPPLLPPPTSSMLAVTHVVIMEMVTYGTSLFPYSWSHRSVSILIRYYPVSWDAVLSGSLVEVELYICAALPVDQSSCRIHYELRSVRLVDDNVFRL